MANHYVHFNITDVVYYGLLLYEQSTIHTIFTYGYYDDKRKDIIHILHFHAHAFITKRKMAKDITSVPVRWSNGINKLYLAYNCYVACIRNIVQNDYLAPLWVYYFASVSTRCKSLLAAGGCHVTNTGHLSIYGALVRTER